jgi:hypothetical protein
VPEELCTGSKSSCAQGSALWKAFVVPSGMSCCIGRSVWLPACSTHTTVVSCTVRDAVRRDRKDLLDYTDLA